MGRKPAATNFSDLDSSSDKVSQGGEEIAVDNAILANTDTAPVNGVEFGDMFRSELHIGDMAGEDLEAFERLQKSGLGPEAAINLLKALVSRDVSDKAFDKAIAGCEGHNIFPVTTPALEAYVRHLGAHTKKAREVLDARQQQLRSLFGAYLHIERTDGAIAGGYEVIE